MRTRPPQPAPEGEEAPAPFDEGTTDLTIEDDRTFLTRLRSSVALLVVLALVGAGVALLIGAALYLAETAIQNTVG